MTKKRVLITGVVSLLGRYLIKVLKKNYALFGTTHNHQSYLLPQDHLFSLNITDSSEVEHLVSKIKPHVVIHLAALSNIDYCEKHPQEVYRVNVGGTSNMVGALKKSSTQLIVCSSNAIFSGHSPPYTETDDPQPLNVYGRTKKAATLLASKLHPLTTVIRFTSMFGWSPPGTRDNDVTFYLKKLEQEYKLYLVNDRIFNPVYALRAAQALRHIIKGKHIGIFHIAGKDKITRYTFVKKIKQVFAPHAQAQLIPVSSAYFPDLAPRPPDATLATTKMEKILRLKPKLLHQELLRMKVEKKV